MHRYLPMTALLPLLVGLGAAPASGKGPSKPTASIPGAMPGDRVVTISGLEGPTYTAVFTGEATVLLGLGRAIRRIDLDNAKMSWQAPAPNTTRAITPLPGPYGSAPGGSEAIAAGADDGHVRIHALADGRLFEQLPGPALGWIVDIAITPDGRDIVAVSIDGQVGWWRDRRRRTLRWPAAASAPQAPDAPPTALGRLEAVAFAPDGRLVLAGRGPERMALAVFDPETLAVLATHHGPRSAGARDHWQHAQEIAFAPDGRSLALGYWGGGLELLSWPTLETRWANELAHNWINRARWQGDGRLWVTGARRLLAVRAADGASIQLRASAPNHALDAFDLSPSGKRAVLGPRSTGVVLLFAARAEGDWRPSRFARPPAAPVAFPQIATPAGGGE